MNQLNLPEFRVLKSEPQLEEWFGVSISQLLKVIERDEL